MSKRNLYIIGAGIVAILIAMYFFLLKPHSTFEQSSTFNALPSASPVIIKVNNAEDIIESMVNNEMITTLGSLEPVNTMLKELKRLNQESSQNDAYHKLLRSGELVIALNYSGKDDISPLIIMAINSKNDQELVKNILEKASSAEANILTTRKYNKVAIHQLETSDNTYYQAIHQGILLVSDKSLLIEDAIRQINDGETEMDPILDQLLKTAGKQSDMNVFINHQHADRLISKQASISIKHKASSIKTYADWTELDVNIGDNTILMSGFTASEKTANVYASTLYRQQPVNSKIEKILPASTAFFVNLGLSNTKAYLADYEEYLEKRNLYFQREDELLKINKETNIDLQELTLELMDKEVTLAGINVDQTNPEAGRIWIMETKSGSTAIAKMLELQNSYIAKKGLNRSDWIKSYDIDSQTSFELYRFPFPNLPKILFGQIFNGVKANWFTIFNNYLIFGDSYRTISKALHANVLGETLAASIEFNEFKNNMNARSNITFFCNTAVSLPVAELLFKEELAGEISTNDDLRKFKAFAWQITSTGEMLYNNAGLLYSSVIKSKPQTIWQSHLDAPFDFKPKFVINHYDRQNKEIVVLDELNNLYLLNNVGRMLWKIKLDAPVLGEIHQIDYFKNGKLQYLFNTENKLYLIDRNGNNVKNFPVNLRSKASNGLAVFDYDNNKDYRYFMAGTDRKIYAYNKEGNLLNGWNVYQTDHLVTHPVQHFRVDGKDYIVASDNMKDYILHRRGIVRVETNDIYPHSANNTIYLEERTNSHEPRMVTTDKNGNLHFTYFDGKHETIELKAGGENHYFTTDDIDNDGEYEYIFADSNQLNVINNNWKDMLSKRFDHTITHQPNIYTFSSNTKKIGLTCAKANKIYLFDSNGTMHPGFPLDGCTEFSIGFITDERSNFNLLVGSPAGYLYNYYVE